MSFPAAALLAMATDLQHASKPVREVSTMAAMAVVLQAERTSSHGNVDLLALQHRGSNVVIKVATVAQHVLGLIVGMILMVAMISNLPGTVLHLEVPPPGIKQLLVAAVKIMAITETTVATIRVLMAKHLLLAG